MADKASRSLVLYGDGLVRLISPTHTHIHSFASRASCGFLSLTNPPDTESEDERVVRELAELLDAHDACMGNNGEHSTALEDKKSVPNISERFMGLKAAICTTNSSVESFGRSLGFVVLQFDELIKNSYPLNEPSQEVLVSSLMATELLKFLGFKGGKALETSEFDLVFLHIEAGEKGNILTRKIFGNEMEFFNLLVGGVMQITPPGSEVGSRLHFSLLMGYGTVSENEDLSLSTSILQKTTSTFSQLVPCQSYSIKGGNLRNNIRHYCPILMAQLQEAVTRKDMAKTFYFEEFKENGGNLTIPADRFLHEVAFKLWKAPKYGA